MAERSIIEVNGEKSSKLAPWCLFNMLVWQSMNKRSASGLPRDTVGLIQLRIQPQPRQCCNIVFEYFGCSYLLILLVLFDWSGGHAVSSDVDNEKEGKDETEKSGGFDSPRRALVAKVVAAVAELLFPGDQIIKVQKISKL